MIKRVARSEATVYPRYGRDWYSYFGPWNSEAKRISMGVAVYQVGFKVDAHVHPAGEETIYCAAGRGRIITPEMTADLEPGVVVFVPAGVSHAAEALGTEPLELVCVHSPAEDSFAPPEASNPEVTEGQPGRLGPDARPAGELLGS